MYIEQPVYNIQEKLLELSYGDFVREKKLAEQYFKSLQDIKDLYAVSLINQDVKLLSFVYQKYKPVIEILSLFELEEEILITLGLIKNLHSEPRLETSAFRMRHYCNMLIQQLQLHYTWLN